MDDVPVFRAVKRRKHVHKQDAVDPSNASDEEKPSQIIKSRTQPRARLKGVQFTNQKANINEIDSTDLVPVTVTQQSPEPTSQYSINSRFVGSSTGQVINVDKHMTAYVDQQMAKKHSSIQSTTNTSTSSATRNTHGHSHSHSHSRPRLHDGDNAHSDEHEESDGSSRSVSSSPSPPPKSAEHPNPSASSSLPAFHPLAEIDLTNLPSATGSGTNTAKSSQSRRKGPRRPRLGRDGKPFRPRPRKRRDSNDIARDGLVEQVLHESATVGAYGSNPAASAAGATHGDGTASEVRQGNNEALDEKMAMEFQRQFLDAVAERQQQRSGGKSGAGSAAKTASGSGGGVGATSALQGPRLGGSRSARAKLVAAMQAAATAGDGKGKEAGRGELMK